MGQAPMTLSGTSYLTSPNCGVSSSTACACSLRRLGLAATGQKYACRSLAAKLGTKPTAPRFRVHFETQGWDFWDESWLRDRLQRMAQQGYENQVSAVVAKLLLRGKVE